MISIGLIYIGYVPINQIVCAEKFLYDLYPTQFLYKSYESNEPSYCWPWITFKIHDCM
jgi:hypothetical protein